MARPIAAINESEKMREKQTRFGIRLGSMSLCLSLKNMLENIVRVGGIVGRQIDETHKATIVNMTAVSMENCRVS